MDLTWSATEEGFRAGVRDWLETNVPRTAGGASDSELGGDDRESFEFRRNWQRTLFEAGWLAMHWPQEYGGGGATLVEQLIFNEEYARFRAPIPINGLGINLVGPTLIVHGTEEQRRRYLPKILSAEEIWCQGYSEPNAGSDLAGLQTRAEIAGDEFVINGQKIWTTLAPYGDWIFTLCRTDPEAPKHQGISYILVPMRQPGVEVRPIKQMSGTAGFGEVFFTDARTPTENLVGKLNDGWRVALTTLMYERGANLLAQQVRFRRLVRELRGTATETKRNGGNALEDPVIRQKLARSLVEVEVMRWNGLRSISPRLKGEAPGPESSTAKLYWSEWYRRLTDTAMEILGPRGRLYDDSADWINEMYGARAATIYAGTSEIQRNIIAERVLGLPKS